MEWRRVESAGLTFNPIYCKFKESRKDFEPLINSFDNIMMKEGKQDLNKTKCSKEEIKLDQEEPVDLSIKFKNIANTKNFVNPGREDNMVDQTICIDLGPVDLSKRSLDMNSDNPSSLQVSTLNDLAGSGSQRKEHKCDFSGCDKVQVYFLIA